MGCVQPWSLCPQGGARTHPFCHPPREAPSELELGARLCVCVGGCRALRGLSLCPGRWALRQERRLWAEAVGGQKAKYISPASPHGAPQTSPVSWALPLRFKMEMAKAARAHAWERGREEGGTAAQLGSSEDAWQV